MAARLAVLTGDLIDSRRIADTRRLYRVLDTTLARLADRHAGAYQRYRGDGFQLALAEADAALEATVALRAALIEHSDAERRWDARLAIAVGRDDWRPGRELASADGPVFIASGRALDALSAGDDRLALCLTETPTEPCQALLLRYLDELLDGWSPYAAEIVGLRLQHDATQQALAERLGIRQPSVHKRLRAARWPLLADTLRHFRESLAREAPSP